MKYTIGLDLGIDNVGWAIFNNDNQRLEKSGVLRFKSSSDASDRRQFRSVKRLRKRRLRRVEDALQKLKEKNFPSTVTVDSELLLKRVSALKHQVSKQDITNIIAFFMKKRGYIPISEENEAVIVDLEGLYPCQYYYQYWKEHGKYRGKNLLVGTKELRRELNDILCFQAQYYPELTQEWMNAILLIFDRRRKFYEGPGGVHQITPYGRFHTTEEIEEYQRMKQKHPNYECYLFERLIGTCKIALGERCASRANLEAEKYNTINDWVNLRFTDISNAIQKDVYFKRQDSYYRLTTEGLEFVLSYCMKNAKATYTNVLKTLGISKDTICGAPLTKTKKIKIYTMDFYCKVQKLIKSKRFTPAWFIDPDSYNTVMDVLNVVPTVEDALSLIEAKLDFSLSDEEEDFLRSLYPKYGAYEGYHALSVSVLKRANEDMINNTLNFMQVRRKFDYDKDAREYFHKNYSDTGELLMSRRYVDTIISSPQVKKTLRQAILIINEIICEKGCLPANIVIESTKELNSDDKKAAIEESQRKQEHLRKEASELLISLFGEESVTEDNIQKVMLYQEMDGLCYYCGKKHLRLDDLLRRSFDVDHILPYSKSYDNSFDNLLLVCHDCNEKKGNHTPYYYLKDQFEEFQKRVQANKKMSSLKKEHLLFRDDISRYELKFFNRNLRDTAYATSELISQIQLFNYYLEGHDHDPIQTLSVSGSITSTIRRRHAIDKDRKKGPQHHAQDAAILSILSNIPLGKALLKSQNDPKFYAPNRKEERERDLEEIRNLLNRVNISGYEKEVIRIDTENQFRMANQVYKNPQKSLSHQNIYKVIEKEDKSYKIDQIDNIYTLDFSKDTVCNQLDHLFSEEDYSLTLLCQDKNKNLFYYLKEIFERYRIGDANPFLEYCLEKWGITADLFELEKHGIRTPSKNGNGPIVQKLRYYSSINTPFFLEKKNISKKENTKIALDNLAQMCTKVYFDRDKQQFLFLPIPSVCVDLSTRKIREDDSYYQLLYAIYIGEKEVVPVVDLYNGNLVKIKKKDKEMEGIISGFDKTLNAITINNKYTYTKIGRFGKNDLAITVYDVSPLGKKKKRLTFSSSASTMKV